MARGPVWRTRQIGCRLSEQEFQALCEVRSDLGLTVRDLLLIAVRRARARLAAERRKQRRSGA